MKRKIYLGKGTSSSDIHRWERAGECRKIDDPRKGASTCKVCGAAVLVLEGPPGQWSKRDPETRFPHAISCPKR